MTALKWFTEQFNIIHHNNNNFFFQLKLFV